MYYTVAFVDKYSIAPLIELDYNGKRIYALLDTGSEQTLVDRKFIEEQGVSTTESDETMTLTGFNGHRNLNVSTVHFDCVAPPLTMYDFPVDAQISDLSVIQTYFDKWTDGSVKVPLLIGSDTLSKIDATIDFEDKLFTWREKN